MSDLALLNLVLLAVATVIGSFALVERRIVSAIRAGKAISAELSLKKIHQDYNYSERTKNKNKIMALCGVPHLVKESHV
jgi:hypothetical protein